MLWYDANATEDVLRLKEAKKMNVAEEKNLSETVLEDESLDEFEFPDQLTNMVRRASLMKRTEPVDKDETIALVKAALGDRSIRKFAEEIGVSASSISRILNGTSTEIRSSLIAFIVECAAPQSGVTLDKLLKAQGFTLPEDRKPAAKRGRWESKQLISDELLLRGYSVRHILEVTDMSIWSNFPTYIIKTDAFPDQGGKWYFIDKLCKQVKRVSIAMIQGWVDGIIAAYYRGLKAKRVSIVLDSLDLFNGMKKMLEKYHLRDEISVILVSMETGQVLEEYVIPLENGVVPESVITGPMEG